MACDVYSAYFRTVPYTWGQRNLDLETLNRGTLEEYPVDRNLNKFDVLVLANILGHLEDPHAAVLKAHKLIRPGGLLVIQTPRFDNPISSLPNFIRKNWRYFISTYFWHFNTKGISRMLENCGFDLPDISNSQRSVAFDYAAKRFLELARIDLLEPLELKTKISMKKIYDAGTRSLDSVRNSSLGQHQINLELLNDSMDVIACKCV